MRALCLSASIATIAGLLVAPAVASQSTTATATQSADTQRLTATCLKVKGSVQWAPIGTESTDTQAWKSVKVDDTFQEGVQIRTGLRSAVIFKFGDDTVVMIDRMTLAGIEEYHRTANTKRTRIGLDYGEVRAGVAEGTGLRSDFKIDSPVATLSKRGTWNFSLRVERTTGRFSARLADRGLVEVLNKRTGRSQQIGPNQWLNQAMLAWAETAKFERQIPVVDAFGQTSEELLALFTTNTGRTGLQPPGTFTSSSTGRSTGATSPTIQASNVNRTAYNLISVPTIGGGPVRSNDGDFGTGAELKSAQRSVLTRNMGRMIKKLFR
ncbi:MAG: FecR domain-containing protein [Phycisphaerae bacterium]|nr:FecR domain-containing protein [Phycisphaerae bacterium]